MHASRRRKTRIRRTDRVDDSGFVRRTKIYFSPTEFSGRTETEKRERKKERERERERGERELKKDKA